MVSQYFCVWPAPGKSLWWASNWAYVPRRANCTSRRPCSGRMPPWGARLDGEHACMAVAIRYTGRKTGRSLPSCQSARSVWLRLRLGCGSPLISRQLGSCWYRWGRSVVVWWDGTNRPDCATVRGAGNAPACFAARWRKPMGGKWWRATLAIIGCIRAFSGRPDSAAIRRHLRDKVR